MRSSQASIIENAQGWSVRLGQSEVQVDDPRSARYELAELLPDPDAYDLAEQITFVDADGTPVHPFAVFFTWNQTDFSEVRANLPKGCRWFGGSPGLYCVRPGADRLEAIALLAAELRSRFGLTIDLGYEKDEWDGSPDRVIHLLLSAISRLPSSDITTAQALSFIRTALPTAG